MLLAAKSAAPSVTFRHLPLVPTGTEERHGGLSRSQTASTSTASRGPNGSFTSSFPQAATAADFPPVAHDALNLDALLTPEERAIRQRVRAYMVGGVMHMRED